MPYPHSSTCPDPVLLSKWQPNVSLKKSHKANLTLMNLDLMCYKLNGFLGLFFLLLESGESF